MLKIHPIFFVCRDPVPHNFTRGSITTEVEASPLQVIWRLRVSAAPQSFWGVVWEPWHSKNDEFHDFWYLVCWPWPQQVFVSPRFDQARMLQSSWDFAWKRLSDRRRPDFELNSKSFVGFSAGVENPPQNSYLSRSGVQRLFPRGSITYRGRSLSSAIYVREIYLVQNPNIK